MAQENFTERIFDMFHELFRIFHFLSPLVLRNKKIFLKIFSQNSVKRHITSRELAWELGVTMRTIHHDIFVLSFDYPIYTKPGWRGGGFITENYKPYTNTLTETELETLCRLYGKSEGKEKEILFRIIRKYGADKLEI